MRFTFCFILLLSSCLLAAQTLPIIPQPQSYKLLEGDFGFQDKPSLKFGEASSEVGNTAISLLQEWQEASGPGAETSNQRIWLGNKKDEALLRFCKKKNIELLDLPEEGYQLMIYPDQVLILGESEAGMLYGVYSFLQLAQTYAKEKRIPCMEIQDYPDFKYRAVMDDISRGPLSNLKFLKKQIRRLSMLKINAFSFYIEHVIKTQSHPDFAPDDGLTPEEFRELSEYAAAYHVKLIGGFQSLGHFRNILRSPTYRHLGASDRMLKPADPEALQFLTEVYEEMIPAFSSEFFNINADEAWDLVRGESKPLVDSLGAGTLFANHVNPLLKKVRQENKQAMIWGDMLLAYPDVFDKISKETIILTWDYAARESFSDWIDPIVNKGFNFWVCPGVLNSNLMMPNWETSFSNLNTFIAEGKAKGASGVMTTVWDDGGGHFFSKDWYGLAYAADQSWKSVDLNRKEFDRRFGQVFYQEGKASFGESMATLNSLKNHSPTQELLYASLSKRMLAPIGQSYRIASTGFSEVEKLLAQAKIELEELILSKPPAGDFLWHDDLDYWQFFIRQLSIMLNTHRELVEIAERYRLAQEEKTQGKNSYVRQLDYCQEKVSVLLNDWKSLAREYRELWLRENRNHWLEEATSIFEDKIEDLISLKSLLSFVQQLDKNQLLPDPVSIRLDIKESPHSFFTFWLVADPIALNKEENFKEDYLGELGGELKARPTPYDWLKYQSPYMDKIDLTELNKQEGTYIQYVYCQISSPKQQEIIAEVESALPFDYILNGKKTSRQKDQLPLLLKEGPNHLILKLKIPLDGQQFSMYLKERTVRNKKQRYRLLE